MNIADTIHSTLGHWAHQRPREHDQFIQAPPKWLTQKMRQDRDRILREASNMRKKTRSMCSMDNDDEEVAE